jgi:hypothetical protein
VIDFRYHIVSLISVFLALAVGIALGAGPLKETIGDSLTGQVQQLRQDRDALRTDLDATKQTQTDQRAYLEAAAPELLSGALTDRRVAIVTVGTVSQDSVDAVARQLSSAGGTVSAQVGVTAAWTDPSLRSFRQALASNLVTYLNPAPAESVGPEVELAQALMQGLTGAEPSAPNELSENSSLMLELLSNDQSKLVKVANPITVPADAVVILTSSDLDQAATSSPSQDVIAAQVALASAAQEASEGAVVATVLSTEGDLVSTILADADLAQNLSTVTGVDQVTGQISVPLALNARIGEVVGHYGFADGETVMPERVTLTPVDRTPESAPLDPASGAGATG